MFSDQTVKPNEFVIVYDGPVGENPQLVIGKWKESKSGQQTMCQRPDNLGRVKSQVLRSFGSSYAKHEYKF